MPFSFLAREAGHVHVCGHRGYSLHYPENTLPGLQAAKAFGATTVEIDVVLTADGELILLHDLTVDRTTNGHGFAADLSLAQIEKLDAGAWLDPRFAGTKIPTLGEVLSWAKREAMGIVLEIKEAERPDRAAERIAELARSTDTVDRVIVISFDHVILKQLRDGHPEMRTEAITHARHVDLAGVLRGCGASSVSIELDMFRADDARALHDAGFAIRLSMPRPDRLVEFWRGGRDIIPHVEKWVAAGLVDSISGDDVPFTAGLIRRAGRAG